MNSNEPIIKFESLEQAKEYLKEWQHRLFLDNWAIKIDLVDCIDDEEDCTGKVDYNREYLTALIRLKNKISQDAICRHSQEHILIHELMHLIIPQTEDAETIEMLYWNTNQHQIMEQMARSLFLTKYNLTFDWFNKKTRLEDGEE